MVDFVWTQRLDEAEPARLQIKPFVVRSRADTLHVLASFLTGNLHGDFINLVCLLDPLEPLVLLLESQIVDALLDLPLDLALHLRFEYFETLSQVLPGLQKEAHLLSYVSD